MTRVAATHATLALTGLEPDNLLAFLALLGLLRALETARPHWQPLVAWTGNPPVATLHVACASVTAEEVAEAADQGMRALAHGYNFNGKKEMKFTVSEFRTLAAQVLADPHRASVVAALSSDGAPKRDGDEVEPTPLCAMFGAGHQHFLERLTDAANPDDADNAGALYRSLFGVWQYDGDPTKGFRWDPSEDRRYAYQFGDPADARNKVGTETGANRLAAIGFAVFTSVPGPHGLATVGVAGRRGEVDICWPLVGVPASLAGHRALLAHPWLADPEQAPMLRAYGVRAVARARRYQVDRYFNFERARVQFL